MMTKTLLAVAGLGLATLLMPTVARADPFSSFGVDYSSAPVYVPSDPSAPGGNFQNPSQGTNETPYNIYVTSDANYGYVLLQTTAYQPGDQFANLYFDSTYTNGNPHTPDLALEVTNSKLFNLSTGNGVDISNSGYQYFLKPKDANNGDVTTIEFKIPFTVFANVALTGGTAFDGQVDILGSQSFGYTVVDNGPEGATGFGVLGGVSPTAVPEPSTLYNAGVVIAVALAWSRRPRSRRAA